MIVEQYPAFARIILTTMALIVSIGVSGLISFLISYIEKRFK